MNTYEVLMVQHHLLTKAGNIHNFNIMYTLNFVQINIVNANNHVFSLKGIAPLSADVSVGTVSDFSDSVTIFQFLLVSGL